MYSNYLSVSFFRLFICYTFHCKHKDCRRLLENVLLTVEYRNNPKFLYRLVLANNVDTDCLHVLNALLCIKTI